MSILNKEIPIFNGFIRVEDLLGDDTAIERAARISYGQGTRSIRDTEKLIRFLIEHDHSSPTEMVSIKLHIKAPLFVRSQWVRHRISSFNEYSARYSEMSDEFYYPSYEAFQKQSSSNKQGRDGGFTLEEYEAHLASMKHTTENAYRTYQALLADGVSREIARTILPVNLMTQFYWQVNGRSLMNFLRLRCHKSAQYEIRHYAFAILEIFREWMPITARAFEDYIMNVGKYSHSINNLILANMDVDSLKRDLEALVEDSPGYAREVRNILSKLGE